MTTLAEIAMNSFVDLGGIGVLAASFMFMLKWMLGSFQTQMKQMTAATRANTVTVLMMQKQLSSHDLTVRGLNPAAGDTQEERNNTAYIVLKQLRSDFDKAINTIIEKQ